jgi:hypothetical protein
MTRARSHHSQIEPRIHDPQTSPTMATAYETERENDPENVMLKLAADSVPKRP